MNHLLVSVPATCSQSSALYAISVTATSVRALAVDIGFMTRITARVIASSISDCAGKSGLSKSGDNVVFSECDVVGILPRRYKCSGIALVVM
jgi:hypothetical protein